jgi:hypothetical protein
MPLRCSVQHAKGTPDANFSDLNAGRIAMNRNRWTTLVLATALFSVISFSVFDKSLDAQDKKAATDKKPAGSGASNPFSGKVLLIQKKYDTSPPVIQLQRNPTDFGGFIIEDALVTELAGIRFLTGHGIERADGEPAGPRISIPLDTIGTILEFDNAEAYKRYEEQLLEKMHDAFDNTMEMILPAPIGPQAPADSPDA